MRRCLCRSHCIYFTAVYSEFNGAGLFALSSDQSGANLPKADCPAGWAFDKSMHAVEGEIGGIPVDAKAALADLENTGYHLMYVKGPDASAGTDERSA